MVKMTEAQKSILASLVKESEYAGQIAQPVQIEEGYQGKYIFAYWHTFYKGESHYLLDNTYHVTITKRGAVQYSDGKKWKKAKHNIISKMV